MSVPQQVREQQERVEHMMRGDSESAEPVETQQETEPQQEQEQEEHQQQEQPQADDAIKQLQAELAKSEQRYRTLNGMIRQKDNTIRQMEQLLSQLQATEENTKKEESSTPTPDEAKDREEYGSDFVDMVERTVARQLARLDGRLQNIEQNVRASTEVTAQTQQERFYAQLAQRVPDWRELDNSPEFAQWLQQSKARVALVQHAMANYDVVEIAELFEHYKAITGTDKQAKEPASAKAARPSLEQKVAPSKGRSSNASASQEKREWTRSEIAQVYRDRRKYTQKDFDALQRDIFSAQKEGRVDFAR